MEDGLYIRVSIVNRTKGYRFYDGEFERTHYDTPSEVYKSMQEKYGRCTGYVYVDTPEGEAQRIGWVFVKRERYDDCDETFLQETWVSVASSISTLIERPKIGR